MFSRKFVREFMNDGYVGLKLAAIILLLLIMGCQGSWR